MTNDDRPIDVAAGGTGAAPVDTVPRRRRRTSLAARGEPAVWLTGGAAALSVLMIVGLFVLVGVYGFSTFWPADASRITYQSDGEDHTLLGEPFRHDVQPANEDKNGNGVLDDGEDLNGNGELDLRVDQAITLWRIGNRDVNGSAFAWVIDSTVVREEKPEDVLVVERHTDGPALGELAALTIDGRLYEQFDEAWPAMQAVLGDVRELGNRIEAIKNERGSIGEERKEADAVLAAVEAGGVGDEDATVDAEALGEAERQAAQEIEAFEQRETELRAEQEELEAQVARFRIFLRDEGGQILSVSRGQRRFNVSPRTALTREQAAEVASVRLVDFNADNTRPADAGDPLMGDEDNASLAEVEGAVVVAPTGDDASRPAIQFVDAEGNAVGEPYQLAPLSIVVVQDGAEVAAGTRVAVEPLAMTLGQVVRAYPPNQLGFFGKLGVYGSRWWEYLSSDPRDANMEGGVWPHIVGTVLLTFIMIVFVVPIGVIAAIYLREYARQGALVSIVRICVNNLAGVPSIVYGVFGLGFFCYGVGGWIDGGAAGAKLDPVPSVGKWLLWVGVGVILGALAIGLSSLAARADKGAASDDTLLPKTFRFAAGLAWATSAAVVFYFVIASVPTQIFGGFFPETLTSGSREWKGQALIWASMTLALLTLPVVIVATEEALASVPRSMREGSYACGASKWQTIQRIVLPRALPGIMTGAILAIARGAGEVAPIMLVGALENAELPVNGEAPFVHMQQAFMHLGFHVYHLGFKSPDAEAARSMVYTTTLLLIAIVLLLNVAAIWLRSRLRRAFSGGAF